ncbi:hypothetical protein RJ640_013380 [Escallonia rubra]|uniref:Integrase catalytic domain-containing protein n=1 Tax=Escallonia rubra TaxID=112253 RepID=A0AA88RG81_9ASTE|nr:hypothetical protein RJ640_013380 [Escallonia rubra]
MTNPDFKTSETKSSPTVIQSKGSSFKAGIILNDTNYDLWSQIMEMHIAEKEKLSFIRGNSQPPTKEDDLYEKWYAENQKVKRWLLMSMSPEIMKRYIRLPTARDIWKALSKAFYDGSNELQVFVLNQRAFSAKQSGRTLSAYYGELTEIFGELDHRDKVIMENGEFEQVRAEILRKDPIPELEACHALIRRESVRRTKMVEESKRTEASAMDIRTRQTIGCGVMRGKLYYLDLVSKSSDKLRQALMVNDSEGEMRKSEIWLWHRRLGHALFGYLKKLFPSLFTKYDVSSFQCEVCELAKSHRVSFPLALNKSPDPFMIIHSDVWGPSKVNSLGGSRWFVTFIDDCTRMTWVQLMKSKSEVNVLFQQFCKMIHTQNTARIQVLRSDNGGEYLSAELQQYLKAHGIIHQTTCSNTPQQNRVDEKKSSLVGGYTQISEDAGNLDISEDELAEPVNQVGKFVEESSQEHAETEVVTPSQSEFDIPHATNTPHQSLAEDAPEPHRKQLPQRLTRVSRSNKGIFLSQRKYALDLLRETGMLACQPVDTPVEEGLKLRIESNQVLVYKGRYQRLIGRLMYLAHTRPDLAYAISIVSQYMHNPGEQHMNAVLRILRYLKSAPGQGILFTKNEDHQSVDVYTDADWAGAVDDRCSTSGYFTFVGGNLVTWRSKKQNVVARSSAEAEFRGIALGVCEALWLRLLLQDLGCVSKQPIKLYCDNKAACDIAHNPVQHDRTKHVEIDRFFIKEKLDEKIMELPRIRSKDQLANILSKAVSSRIFSKFLSKLGIWDIYAPT